MVLNRIIDNLLINMASRKICTYWATQPYGSMGIDGQCAGLSEKRVHASKLSEYNGPIPESAIAYIQAHEKLMKIKNAIKVDEGSNQNKFDGIPPELAGKLSSAMSALRFAERQLKSDRKITPELFLILTDVDVRDLPKPTVKVTEPTISAATFKERLDGVMRPQPTVKQPSLDELLRPKVFAGAADAPSNPGCVP